jgi:GT2 family glycosyltransferase
MTIDQQRSNVAKKLQPQQIKTPSMLGISVIVCTRNRGAGIHSTVATILANRSPSFELIIIDQSTSQATAEAVASFNIDSRLRYITSATRGLSVARNIGMAEAQGELVLMTDDDCDVAEDWVAQMAAAFDRHPEVACVFCDVSEGLHNKEEGFIPHNIHSHDMIIERITEYKPGIGVGAGMGLRRSMAQEVGGFDELLGAGMDFASGEEVDMVLRLLLKGRPIYHTKSTHVIHYGFRTHAEGRNLVRGYMYGSSAVYAKLMKCGHWNVLPLYLKVIYSSVLTVIIDSVRKGKLPPVFGRISYLIKGFIRAWSLRVDRKSVLFLPISHKI